LLAITVANVDAMSHGRVELGLGAGWFTEEHTAYGFSFPELGERFDVLEEQLAVVDGLWRTPLGQHFSFAGRHYNLNNSPRTAQPSPITAPDHRRRSRHPPHACVGGKVCSRVQHAFRVDR
jgi:alkanesulfonate monooxygenase SsuD/methylene tetrahydromethanopterin reductase-like flavin-dependent oxidoreductase (luciferase family)